MATLTEIFSQRVQVIRVPTETNFNRFEDRGDFASAMVFMGGSLLAFTAAGYYFAGGSGALHHLIIGLVSSKDKALGVLKKFDDAVARQRRELEDEVDMLAAARQSHAGRYADHAHGM